MKKVISYLTSLGLAAAVAFGTGYHETLDALIFTVVWILIVVGVLSSVMIFIGLIAMSLIKDKVDDETIEKWHKLDKPKWWVSVPISTIWLVAFISVEWTATAVVYLIQTIALWVSIMLMHHIMINAQPENKLVKKSVRKY